MIGIVDADAFYASCFRAFDPKLAGRPVIVLSNNDGNVIARSKEAKALGIPMGAAFFEVGVSPARADSLRPYRGCVRVWHSPPLPSCVNTAKINSTSLLTPVTDRCIFQSSQDAIPSEAEPRGSLN